QAADMIGAKRRLGALGHWFCSPYSPLPVTGGGKLSPHLIRDLHDEPQLRPLFVVGENIAFFGRGEAALRRQAKLIEVDEFGGLIYAAFDVVLAFKGAALARYEAEHDGLALGHEAQRLEAAGALGIVFHEIAVHVDRVEQELGDRLVTAPP